MCGCSSKNVLRLTAVDGYVDGNARRQNPIMGDGRVVEYGKGSGVRGMRRRIQWPRHELQNPYHRFKSGRRLQGNYLGFMRLYTPCKVAFSLAFDTGNSVLTGMNTGTGEKSDIGDRPVGLQEAFDKVRPGERIMYRNSQTYVDPKLIPQDTGRLDVKVWTRQVDAGGWQSLGTAGYEGVDSRWIAGQEQILRDLGIDPDAYNLIPIPQGGSSGRNTRSRASQLSRFYLAKRPANQWPYVPRRMAAAPTVLRLQGASH
jgi:hypothetical protein